MALKIFSISQGIKNFFDSIKIFFWNLFNKLKPVSKKEPLSTPQDKIPPLSTPSSKKNPLSFSNGSNTSPITPVKYTQVMNMFGFNIMSTKNMMRLLTANMMGLLTANIMRNAIFFQKRLILNTNPIQTILNGQQNTVKSPTEETTTSHHLNEVQQQRKMRPPLSFMLYPAAMLLIALARPATR